MELEELENINKNDFLPLLPHNIKQELFDSNETGNLCDSVEKQVDTIPSKGASTTPSKCVWCSQSLSGADNPKLLECLHVACSACVTTKFSELDRALPPLVHCPECNMASQMEGVIDNQFLIEQISSTEELQNSGGQESDTKAVIKCSSCSDDANATSWCVECSEYICDSCVQAHQRLKITKDHTIKPKEEATAESQNSSATGKNLMCPVHSQEKLSLFCETCEKLTCRDCQLADHRDHKYKFAHEIATETRNNLNSLLSEITYKRVLLTSAMKVIDDRQSLIADKKKELIKDITNMVLKITNTVNLRGKQLVMRLNEVCDSKLKVLNEKKEALQQLSGHTDHCIDFVQNALDKGSDSAVLFSNKTLARHLQKVKCQRADIPNPEIPVRIQVQLSQVNELQKVIAQLGTIIVDGKAYPPMIQNSAPPVAGPVPNRQQPSPTMAPPMRPGMGPPGMPGAQTAPAYPQNGPPIYNSTSPNQAFNNMQLNRQFSQEGPTRFPNMGMPNRQGQPHVSSSTHPQNMDISLRGLLNNQGAGQSPCHNMGGFNAPPSYNASQPSGPPQGIPQMRPPYMSGHPSGHQSYSQTASGGSGSGVNSNPANFMAANGPRFQNYQRMPQSHSSAAMQQPPPAHRSMLQNSGAMGYANQQTQQQYNQSMAPQQAQQMRMMQHSGAAKWHIPQSMQQQQQQNQNGFAGPSGQFMQQFNMRQDSFKISLKSPPIVKNPAPNITIGSTNVIPNVTSTNPKTPSPSTGLSDNSKDSADSIDKLCEESMKDLMTTIAKLDSNGVQVLPEGRSKATSPLVHSSTDMSAAADDKNSQKDDPNEDWCAVCLDGGELMCCDKCPKVFHQNCHIPSISNLPDESETWQCLLCYNFADMPLEAAGEKRTGDLSLREIKIMQRIVLEMYCQYEVSLAFREPEPLANEEFYNMISNPICLDDIKAKLDLTNPAHYTDVQSFVNDVRLMFKNSLLYHQEKNLVTKIIDFGRELEQFFEQQMMKWLPSYSHRQSDDDERFQCPLKRMKKIIEE
ncbi:E3 ubiquitin-protein ligase TRIM33 isoform X2 [Phlebotomus argentipes]|uniref:E3 ubiquitin-protein ligase TRIM33 isoform X2 n=1 Tax=Phlebotomus argentipes TaxID=94469 RepID=UPI002893507E|nr:E3 ubiquitin-protein ligase TRIM33 isoform X2 [Phlebotomus argentipes]